MQGRNAGSLQETVLKVWFNLGWLGAGGGTRGMCAGYECQGDENCAEKGALRSNERGGEAAANTCCAKAEILDQRQHGHQARHARQRCLVRWYSSILAVEYL